jgi:glycosyltransferase involved in cell wall biosynthesis
MDEIKELSGDKKNILIIDQIGSFTKDFKEYLEDKKYNVVSVPNVNNALCEWADYIWCEWADNNAVALKDFKHKTVIRLHGYEAYLNQHLFSTIPWDCKNVVFVADHIEKKMKGIVPSLNGQCRVISNGVDVDKFYIKNENRQELSIGYAGLLNGKKNPMRLAEIIKKYDKATFHLRVDWQDPFLKDSFEYETRDCTNIVYHSRYDNLNDFWNQVKYSISFSDIESFSYNVAESMASGCRPIIYSWKGAEDIWRSEDIFTHIDEIDNFFTEKIDMEKNRKYILDKYPLDESLYKMKEILTGEVK